MVKFNRLILVLMLAGVSLIAGCYFGYGSVAGYLYTLSDSPGVIQIGSAPLAGSTVLVGASVSVTGSEAVAYTNEQGRFQIDQVGAGPQSLIATTGDGLNMTKRKVVIQRNQVTSHFILPSWTVLVYMAADNDLMFEARKDLNEMEQVGSGADVNVVVQYDGYYNGDSRRYYMTRDSDQFTVHSPVVESLGEVDMSDPDSLDSFITWGVTRFPAEHIMLVLWDHGGGVYPESVSAQGIAFEQRPGAGDYLSTAEMRLAIASAGQKTGVKIDVLAFDACLMQMLEIGYELQGLVDFMAGSEEVTPGEGFPYDTMLESLRDHPDLSPRAASIMLVNRFVENYQRTEAVCMSAVDLEGWSAFTSRVKTFAAELDAALSQELAHIRGASQLSQRFEYHENADLYDFARRIADLPVNAALKAAAYELVSKWDETVIASARSNKADYMKNSHGLAVLLPTSAIEMGDYDYYDQLLWSADSRWDEFLAKLIQ